MILAHPNPSVPISYLYSVFLAVSTMICTTSLSNSATLNFNGKTTAWCIGHVQLYHFYLFFAHTFILQGIPVAKPRGYQVKETCIRKAYGCVQGGSVSNFKYPVELLYINNFFALYIIDPSLTS